jgi:hypothetical protein
MRSEPACVRLAADEGEVAAQLQEQIPKVDQETALDLRLLRLAGDGSAFAGKKRRAEYPGAKSQQTKGCGKRRSPRFPAMRHIHSLFLVNDDSSGFPHKGRECMRALGSREVRRSLLLVAPGDLGH